MPHLIFAATGRAGLDRCRRFLAGRNEAASKRATDEIIRQLSMLEHFPRLGRPYQSSFETRELSIRFGRGGYVALYEFDETQDTVTLIGFRHQREAGYGD